MSGSKYRFFFLTYCLWERVWIQNDACEPLSKFTPQFKPRQRCSWSKTFAHAPLFIHTHLFFISNVLLSCQHFTNLFNYCITLLTKRFHSPAHFLSTSLPLSDLCGQHCLKNKIFHSHSLMATWNLPSTNITRCCTSPSQPSHYLWLNTTSAMFLRWFGILTNHLLNSLY